MKLKLEIKQVENVILIKVLEDLDFMKLDKKALEKSKICVCGRANTLLERIVDFHINIADVEISNCSTYQSYDFETELEAAKNREEIEKTVALYNEILEGKYLFKVGEIYYYVSCCGGVYPDTWQAFCIDIYRYQNNNTFETREEAQRKYDIINFANENKYEFTEEEWERYDIDKYFIRANTVNKRLVINCYATLKPHNAPCFKDRETAQKVADYIGYDDFMKYC